MNVEEMIAESGITLEEIASSENGIYCLDENRTIVYWNPAAEKITGYSSATMVGSPCFQSGLHHCDVDGRSMCTSMCPIMATIFDGKSRGQRVSAMCDDGNRKWLDVRTQPLAKNGQICGALEYFTPAED